MLLKPVETELQGFWIDLGSAMVPDSTWERIKNLTDSSLILIKQGKEGKTLYRDPADGRFWELIYSRPELKDGGPPLLKEIAADFALQIYDLPKEVFL